MSTKSVAGPFRAPRDRKKEPLEDYELGGLAINDASAGLEVQVWRGRYLDGAIVLDVPGVVEPVSVLEIAGVTEFQFTFDQNMQPAIAYVVNDQTAHWYWFDATVPGFETLDLPEGSITPRCTLDDKRDAAGTRAAVSDIILTYLRDGVLYFRAQRERYEDEHELETDLEGYELGQFGMNRRLRLQWQLVPRPPEEL
ncbi:MAG: hypothetical protein C0P79_012690 [Gammaproteobacteria bacterium]